MSGTAIIRLGLSAVTLAALAGGATNVAASEEIGDILKYGP